MVLVMSACMSCDYYRLVLKKPDCGFRIFLILQIFLTLFGHLSIAGDGLTGSIPTEIWMMTNMIRLNVCEFHGVVDLMFAQHVLSGMILAESFHIFQSSFAVSCFLSFVNSWE